MPEVFISLMMASDLLYGLVDLFHLILVESCSGKTLVATIQRWLLFYPCMVSLSLIFQYFTAIWYGYRLSSSDVKMSFAFHVE